nr:probable methyltransferase PMT15 [Tanacetum cinerariifolium]
PEVSSSEEVAGGAIANWPKRLDMVPPRISSQSIDGVTPETFQEDVSLWKKRIAYYKTVNNQLGQPGRYRNLLDMNAFLGGFAASLVEDPLWVMNIVPVEAKADTLGAIYERGLIGTYQSWCEAMSTYPRTYDLIHADSVFTLYKDRCEMEDIMLEMDRILRPEGSVIIRDDVDLLVKVKRIADGLNWESQIVDHEDGPMMVVMFNGGWSIGGRFTLPKSVLGSMPIFHMSIFKVPSYVLKTLESIRSRFFNGQDHKSRKASWVKWDNVLTSRDKGGLGVAAFVARTNGQACPYQLGNLNVCAPFVVPGSTETTPNRDCCLALQAVDHDCLCNTIRVASRLPTQCNFPLSCGN